VASGNADVVSKPISTFLCPSDWYEPRLAATGNYGIGGSATQRAYKTNYDFSAATADQDYFNDWEKGSGLGSNNVNKRRMFGENSDTRIASVLDGTSNTVAIVETLRWVADGSCPAWGYRAWVMTGIDLAKANINSFAVPESYTWVSDHTTIRGRLYEWALAGSMHPGGCNVTLADGSVRFLSETTDRTIREAIVTVANGETTQVP
jgi:prepilin-type processing-associated H-X9-DG protein